MNGDVAMFAQVMTVIVASTAALMALALGTRLLWRLGSRPDSRSVPAADDSRLQRLELAVETIAVEVERISEAQRFTVALLSERLPGHERVGELGTGGGKRTNTPH